MRRIVRVIGIAAALLVLILLSLPFLVSANSFRPALESRLSAALGRRVSIGNLTLSVLKGGVTADSLSIAEDPAFGGAPFLRASSLKVAVELWPLIVSRKLNVTGLVVERPEVTLLQSAEGRWNYASLGAGASAQASAPAPDAAAKGGLDFSVKLIRIAGGRFSLGKEGRPKPLTLEGVNLEVRDFAPSAAFPFTFDARLTGGGDIKLEGKAGPPDATDATLTPLAVTLDIAGLNLASALAGTAPDLAGTASLHAAASSSGGRVALSGKLKAEGLKLAKNGKPARRPVEFAFAIQHDLRTHAGSLQQGDIRIGSAAASLTGTYAERGGAIVIQSKFSGSKMPVPELAELLPPLGIALPNGSRLEGGTATALLNVQGPVDRAVADGSLSLDNTRLANFDLGGKMMLIAALAGVKAGPNTDIETLSAKVKYGPGGTAVDGLRFVARDIGELNGAGAISPANALDFKMAATVRTTRSAALSRTAIPFFIQGTSMNPVFQPDVRNMARTALQSEAEKRLKGTAGEAAVGILDRLLGGKKK